MSSNGCMVSGNLCPQFLNLLLELPVPLEDPLNTPRLTALLQLLDLPLQVLNMFLCPLSDVPLRLSIVCALACQLGFAEVGDGPLASTGTFLPWFFHVCRYGAIRAGACHGVGDGCCTCHDTESCGDSDVEEEEEEEDKEEREVEI